jgi:hypothetical protein
LALRIKFGLVTACMWFATQSIVAKELISSGESFTGARVRIPFRSSIPAIADVAGKMATQFGLTHQSAALELFWQFSGGYSNGIRSGKGQFYFEGQPLCGYGLTLTSLLLKESSVISNSLILGLSPDFGDEIRLVESSHLDSSNLIDTYFLRAYSRLYDSLKVVDSCLFKKGNVLIPTNVVMASMGSSTFKLWVAQDQILRVEKKAFFAEIEAFPQNRLDSQMEVFDISTHGNGYLTNDLFDVRTHSVERAFEVSNVFKYSIDDMRFHEASIFTHANQAWDFFTSLGFKDDLDGPIHLNINVLVNGTKNNAIYEPGNLSTKTPPTISVGSGDGITLSDLTLDTDVVTHELAHHLIYRKLTSTSGESLILHEGLADFLAFAKSGDACLGESICPASSKSCRLRGKCLRTGNNELVYGSSEYMKLSPHQKGQVVSGLLWDLHKMEDISLVGISSVLIKAVDFLYEESDLQDFVYAFALADQLLNQGSYSCLLKEVATTRGLLPDGKSIDCRDFSTWPKAKEARDPSSIKVVMSDPPEESQSAKPTDRERVNLGFCSLVTTSQSNFAILWLLSLPLVLCRRFQFW